MSTMNKRVTVMTTAVLMTFALATGAEIAAQSPIAKTKSVTATATIQAIDSTKRLVTLRDEKGQDDTYSVSPDFKRFNELKVGDTVKMEYHEAVVLEIRKPGEKPSAGAVSAMERGKGALPSGRLSVQDTATVTVKAIDPAVPSVTVATSDGRTVTRKVENKKNLEGVKVGDLVDITYSRALVMSIERAK